MPHRFTTNRKLFADLIYRLKRFSEKEIVERFRKEQNGDIVIDGSQNVVEYLRDLREQGVLKVVGDKYVVTL